MPKIYNAIINDFVSFRLFVHTKSCCLTWLPWANPETPRFVSQQLFFELTSSTSPNIENFACNNSVFTNRKRCLLVRQVPQGLFHTGSSITLLFYYLAPLRIFTIIWSFYLFFSTLFFYLFGPLYSVYWTSSFVYYSDKS